MKNFLVLCFLMSLIGGILAGSMESHDNNSNLVGYWMLSIAGASMLVWLVIRYFYPSKAGKGKA